MKICPPLRFPFLNQDPDNTCKSALKLKSIIECIPLLQLGNSYASSRASDGSQTSKLWSINSVFLLIDNYTRKKQFRWHFAGASQQVTNFVVPGNEGNCFDCSHRQTSKRFVIRSIILCSYLKYGVFVR